MSEFDYRRESMHQDAIRIGLSEVGREGGRKGGKERMGVLDADEQHAEKMRPCPVFPPSLPPSP